MTTPRKNFYFRTWTGFHRLVFTTSKGRVAGKAMGMPVLMLTTTGRTSGKPRKTMLTAPLQIGDAGETLVLAASFGGDDSEPSWCRNIRKTPEVTVTMRGKTTPMHARIATTDERAELWPRLTAAHDNYAGYQTQTQTEIPLILLEG